jgi:hypothetical protein
MNTIAVAAMVAVAGLVCGASQSSVRATGVLRGTTQISFGCPGPTTEPPCNPWRPFPLARFTVARRSVTGDPLPGTTVLVRSDATAHFRLRLHVGSYLITPLRQANARGGALLTVRIRAGTATTALVRFFGFPMME